MSLGQNREGRGLLNLSLSMVSVGSIHGCMLSCTPCTHVVSSSLEVGGELAS